MQSQEVSTCHSLWVELVEWSGNGYRSDGHICDKNAVGQYKKCDITFYICVDYKTP